jgi:YHS domain-containing protein
VLRFILYLIVFMLAVSVLRSVVGYVSRIFAELFGPPANAQSNSASGRPPRAPRVPASEALKKDPVCGTFIAPSTAVMQTIAGETYYFCSVQCRDKFQRS